MTRREFAAAALACAAATAQQESGKRPRLLIRASDPFSGLPLLRERYAAGLRPSDDIAGWALQWQITGQDQFAQRALAEMQRTHPPTRGKASRTWVDYARWSLAFDWLYDFSGFDANLKDRIAGELAEAAATMLALPELARPDQVSYHNYSVRYLALAAFSLAAIENHPSTEQRCRPLRARADAAFDNLLELTELVTPLGSYHESMDYMRITWTPLALLAELRRTTTGIDPARAFTVFRNFGDTYLYKLLPNGTPSREGDNEYPLLDGRDSTVLGYAVQRFKDPYSAWLLRNSGFAVKQWTLPVLQFLWDDPSVSPRDPAQSRELELPHLRHFPGVGHVVMRDGWRPDSTWIQFKCGPYFSKHQHLDQNHFSIYHGGYLAIDSGADYTDSESPHYLNYYRRTVAHNSVLVYDPGEKFFWSENVLAAANDGGQRMDSSRFWNTVRSLEDWRRTRDLWNLGCMRATDSEHGQYHYAIGDATNAYSQEKVRRFTRELLFTPAANILYVFDRVESKDAAFRKVWLLHGVNEPVVNGADTFRFREGTGELLVHSLLPEQREVIRRGGPGAEFWCPGDDHGGAWGSGENWPLEPAEGGPLPSDPKLQRMWKTFWGEEFNHIEASNRRNVVPGAWRVEVSPVSPSEEDVFLHVIEIGDRGKTGNRRVQRLTGTNVAGAAVENSIAALFSTAGAQLTLAEVTLPDLAIEALLLTSLHPNAVYELNFSGPNIAPAPTAASPGTPVAVERLRSNEKGSLLIRSGPLRNTRLRITLV